jgi:hypothetical protein
MELRDHGLKVTVKKKPMVPVLVEPRYEVMRIAHLADPSGRTLHGAACNDATVISSSNVLEQLIKQWRLFSNN